VASVLERGDDRGHEVGERSDRAGQNEADCDEDTEENPVASNVMPAHRGALSSHLRLYNELA
jgi:hypothetical protein